MNIPLNRLKKTGILLVSLIAYCLVITGLGVFPQSMMAADSSPCVEIRESLWDFGYLPQKSEVHHTFYIYNTGSSDLMVEKIKAGCSCTSISKVDAPVKPGDSAAIIITFKSGRYRHQVVKTTEVHTNDPKTPVHKLKIAANVYKKSEPAGNLSINPPKINRKVYKSGIIDIIDTLEIVVGNSDSLAISILYYPVEIVEKVDVTEFISANEKADIIIYLIKDALYEESKGELITFAFYGNDTSIVSVPIRIKK